MYSITIMVLNKVYRKIAEYLTGASAPSLLSLPSHPSLPSLPRPTYVNPCQSTRDPTKKKKQN